MMLDADAPPTAPRFAGLHLFLVSLLLLFLELACIRWFPAHVLYLTFFTNVVLLACFLGMSLGCLAARRRTNFLAWTPALLALALGAALTVETLHNTIAKHVAVGNRAAPEQVFFGTELPPGDVASFVVPVEVLGGLFFVLLALAFVGPGQELGRAFDRIPDRLRAYTINVFGSLVGIGLFALLSWNELPPIAWFGPVALGLAWFLRGRGQLTFARAGLLVLLLIASSMTTGPYLFRREQGAFYWSPYYRIDYTRLSAKGVTLRTLAVNQVGHQQMQGRDRPFPAYALPHLLHRDCGLPRFRRVLVIGAGSGNDVSRALQWGAEHVDAVEIDPVIQRLGAREHPDQPYQDPHVSVHLDDGRNFLRSAPDGHYDLIIYGLVDSLVLHSSYSNLRLESYLFTRQALKDVRRCLAPDGWFVMSNFFRQGWIVARLKIALEQTFGTPPAVFSLPYRAKVNPEESFYGFTIFICGQEGALQPLRSAYAQRPEYWVDIHHPLTPEGTPNGFEQRPATPPVESADPVLALGQEVADGNHAWMRFIPATVGTTADELVLADDDWPFLYLRQPMLPDVTWHGMAVMGGLALLLLLLFRPREAVGGPGGWGELARMFFLGAGFMLIETRAVVHMALLFGSTWMVNTVVFAAVLAMILLANLFVGAVRPKRTRWSYVALFLALAVNFAVPLEAFLGWGRVTQTIASALMVFAPIACAGVVFAVSFARSNRPDRAFGANVAGALAGGLAENCSLLLGFRYLVLVGAAFYLVSALAGARRGGEVAQS